MSSPHHSNIIASKVIHTFDALAQKYKPRARPNGAREWTVLGGIVISHRDSTVLDEAVYTCVALGTGMRCLPHSVLPKAKGCVLHDWHAETLALRAFNLYLLQECSRLAQDADYDSPVVERNVDVGQSAGIDDISTFFQPLKVKSNIRIHMYISEAPCGDASMELTMSKLDDATPWESPATESSLESQPDTLLGRGYFSQLGVVRRKPARADAPLSLSKSCSDKLALKQCTSLLSSLTSLLIAPDNAYLSDVVLPHEQIVRSTIQRCFGVTGRMSALVDENGKPRTWPSGYSYRPFEVTGATEPFSFARGTSIDDVSIASNVSVMWTPHVQEVLIGGVIQGSKQFSPRGASACSRSRIWKLCQQISDMTQVTAVQRVLEESTYSQLKRSAQLLRRREVQNEVRTRALKPWIRNEGDDDFGLDVLDHGAARQITVKEQLRTVGVPTTGEGEHKATE